MYYILKNDGTSLFEQPYPFDFCMHCLMLLIDTDDVTLQNCRLMHFELVRQEIRPTRPQSVSSLMVPEIVKTHVR